MNTHHLKPYAAEALGTFMLTLGVSLSLLSPMSMATPLIAALTVGIFVYIIGSISGAHLNPAVTIGLWSVGAISIKNSIGYIVSQIIGAMLAWSAVLSYVEYSPVLTAENSMTVVVFEALGAFLLVFGIGSVVHQKVSDVASGLVIGGSLLLGILLSSVASNGVLNPAVALGINSFSVAYLIGPILGGVAGAWASKWLYAQQ